MAVTWTKATVDHENPFDGSHEIVIEVGSVLVDNIPAPNEHYTFADGTTDPEIQSAVETDLASKGYTWT